MSFNITPVASGYQEIHPCSGMNIDSVKINTSLIKNVWYMLKISKSGRIVIGHFGYKSSFGANKCICCAAIELLLAIWETYNPHPAATACWPLCLSRWKFTISDLIQQSHENITRHGQNGAPVTSSILKKFWFWSFSTTIQYNRWPCPLVGSSDQTNNQSHNTTLWT